MRFNVKQKGSLSTYCGNLSISWFAAGIIGPIVTKQPVHEIIGVMLLSLALTTTFLNFMLILIRERKSKK